MFWQIVDSVIVVPLLRSVGGWLYKALEDKKVSRYEWKELLKTIIRTTTIGTFVLLGAQNWGIDINYVGSAVTAILLDWIVSAIKEHKKVK